MTSVNNLPISNKTICMSTDLSLPNLDSLEMSRVQSDFVARVTSQKIKSDFKSHSLYQ